MGSLVGGKDASEEDRQRVRPVLNTLLADSESYTRWKAIEGVLRMGPAAKPLVPALVERLTDPAPYVRRAACITLGAIGPEAKEAIPKLRELAGNPELKELAQDALRRIETDTRKVDTKPGIDNRRKGRGKVPASKTG
jgi:HEAT repeat protein